MVAEGWAWQYTQYDKSAELREAQEKAKKKMLGLWADADPIALGTLQGESEEVVEP